MSNKDRVQPLIDSVVKKYKAGKRVSTFYGIPASELTKTELLDMIDFLIADQEAQMSRHHKDLEVLSSLSCRTL